MKRSLLVLLLVVAAAGTALLIVVVRETPELRDRPREQETAARQHTAESQQALRKAAEFLQPDTKSDIRFGKPKSSNQPATASPAP